MTEAKTVAEKLIPVPFQNVPLRPLKSLDWDEKEFESIETKRSNFAPLTRALGKYVSFPTPFEKQMAMHLMTSVKERRYNLTTRAKRKAFQNKILKNILPGKWRYDARCYTAYLIRTNGADFKCSVHLDTQLAMTTIIDSLTGLDSEIV